MEVTIVARIGYSICTAPASAVFPHRRCGWIGPTTDMIDHANDHHAAMLGHHWVNSGHRRAAVAVFATVVHFPDDDGINRPWRATSEERRLMREEKMTLHEARVHVAARAHRDGTRRVW